jgi:hypothetical protein
MSARRKCKNCGQMLMRAETTPRTKGWAHVRVRVGPGRNDWSRVEEACEINWKTLKDKRGTTYAEPVGEDSPHG